MLRDRFRRDQPARWSWPPWPGITDHVYRLMLRRIGGVGLVTMEFISSEAIARGNARQLRKMVFSEEERPLSIQIYGSDPERMAAAADIVEELAPDVCDINMGCPANKVLKGCAGAALMGDLPLARRIVRGGQEPPVDPADRQVPAGPGRGAPELPGPRQDVRGRGGRRRRDACADRPPDVHGPGATGGASRSSSATSRFRSSATATWRLPRTRWICWRETGCDGVMIGRATMKNPWIFRQIADAMAGRPSARGDALGASRPHARALRRDRGEGRRSARGACTSCAR